jgi:hypothetical protein
VTSLAPWASGFGSPPTGYVDVMTTPADPTPGHEPIPENESVTERESATEKYDEVDPEDVADDAIEFFRKGNDDPTPVTPPERDPDEPPPPNA